MFTRLISCAHSTVTTDHHHNVCERLFLAIIYGGRNGITRHVPSSVAERVATLAVAAPAPLSLAYGSGCWMRVLCRESRRRSVILSRQNSRTYWRSLRRGTGQQTTYRSSVVHCPATPSSTRGWGKIWVTVGQASSRQSLIEWFISDDLGSGH